MLGFLLRRPQEDFALRDIARATDLPVMTVSRSIKDFEKLSMVRIRRIGNAFAISISDDSPEVELIRNIAECCKYG